MTADSRRGETVPGSPASRTGAWLEPRLERVPEELADRVRSLVTGREDGAAADVLASIALEELERLADAPQNRDAAVRLLAADAVLTWAFEAAAELGADVPALADATGLRGRIGALLRARDAGSREGAG